MVVVMLVLLFWVVWCYWWWVLFWVPVVMVMGTKDSLWRSGLKWVEAMKKLEMDFSYFEVKKGGHVLPVIAKLPAVFAFFEKHRRKPLTKP